MPDPASADPRVLQAADRTRAAWVRTGLVALAAGAGARTTPGSVPAEPAIRRNATLLVPSSAFRFAAGVRRDLRPGHASPQRSDLRRIPPVLLGVRSGRTGSAG